MAVMSQSWYNFLQWSSRATMHSLPSCSPGAAPFSWRPQGFLRVGSDARSELMKAGPRLTGQIIHLDHSPHLFPSTMEPPHWYHVSL